MKKKSFSRLAMAMQLWLTYIQIYIWLWYERRVLLYIDIFYIFIQVPSYPAPLGPLPEYGYVYYPSFEGLHPSYAPDISSCYAPDLLQRIGKPLDVSVYLPLLQEPHEIPLLDVPLNYQVLSGTTGCPIKQDSWETTWKSS